MARKPKAGIALEAALKDGSINRRDPVQIVGMIDKSKRNSYIRFSITGCANWLELPVAMIAAWETVGQRSCDDHSHPVARLTMKRPKGDAAETLFYDMLRTMTASRVATADPVNPLRASAVARLRPGGGGAGFGTCTYYACGTCGDGTVMLCPTGDVEGCLPNICSDVLVPTAVQSTGQMTHLVRRGAQGVATDR